MLKDKKIADKMRLNTAKIIKIVGDIFILISGLA